MRDNDLIINYKDDIITWLNNNSEYLYEKHLSVKRWKKFNYKEIISRLTTTSLLESVTKESNLWIWGDKNENELQVFMLYLSRSPSGYICLAIDLNEKRMTERRKKIKELIK